MKIHQECPGEFACENDLEVGEAARRQVERKAICHRNEGGCHLYFTKQESTPMEYHALLEAAVRLKERKLSLLDLYEPSFEFEETALIVFDRADRIVTNEKYQDDEDKEKPKKSFKKGDSSAFNYSDEQLREMYAAKQRKEDRKRQRKLSRNT